MRLFSFRFRILALVLGVLGYYSLWQYRSIAPTTNRVRSSGRQSHIISYGCALVALLICLVLALASNFE